MGLFRKWFAVLAAMIAFSSPLPSLPGESAIEIPAEETRCLAIGIDRFVNEENTSPCSANNTEVITGLFGDCLPEGTKITRRVNSPADSAEMEALILEAFSGSGEEDTSILYLSTHGIVWEEEGREKTAWILSDGKHEEAMEPETLRNMMDRIPGKKVLILDCCHAGAAAELFKGPEWRVLAGCRAEEDCYFWAAGEVNGTGYFTSALENALRASAREQIDPDGNGEISLAELAGRIREIYGVSTAVFLPEADEEALFSPPKTQTREGILNLRFDSMEEETNPEGERYITLRFHFLAESAVKLEYRLVPSGESGWDFNRAAKLPDRERSGQKRGVLSPGEKDRFIRVNRDRLGETGQALLQIVSSRGPYDWVPVPEATYVIRSQKNE